MDRLPQRVADVQGRDLVDEYVFLDPAGDRMLVLNHTAREVYLACDGTRTPAAIAAHLVELYGIDEPTARADVEELLAELARAGLVTSSSS